jgi:molecular chaperone Hsp33
MSEGPEHAELDGVVVTTSYVRTRNVLMARAQLVPLFLDYHLHLADHRLAMAPEHDRLLKAMLAAFVLHAASRPRPEMIAWTVNLQQPRLNLFATTDNETGDVVGRVFTENVKAGPDNLFYVETVRGRQPRRRSMITFAGGDMFAMAEAFYRQSEQRPGRLLDLGDEHYALLSAHPGCDLAWLEGVRPQDLDPVLQTETVVPMERRLYRWRCGCTEKRMLDVLAPAMRDDPDGLFAGDSTLAMTCPRCAKPYRISREAMEAHLAEPKRT